VKFTIAREPERPQAEPRAMSAEDRQHLHEHLRSNRAKIAEQLRRNKNG
jgi:hypothetical protein